MSPEFATRNLPKHPQPSTKTHSSRTSRPPKPSPSHHSVQYRTQHPIRARPCSVRPSSSWNSLSAPCQTSAGLALKAPNGRSEGWRKTLKGTRAASSNKSVFKQHSVMAPSSCAGGMAPARADHIKGIDVPSACGFTCTCAEHTFERTAPCCRCCRCICRTGHPMGTPRCIKQKPLLSTPMRTARYVSLYTMLNVYFELETTRTHLLTTSFMMFIDCWLTSCDGHLRLRCPQWRSLLLTIDTPPTGVLLNNGTCRAHQKPSHLHCDLCSPQFCCPMWRNETRGKKTREAPRPSM